MPYILSTFIIAFISIDMYMGFLYLYGQESEDRHEHTLRMALINVRSLSNKSFILNDFFLSRELDYMFLTETWLQTGDFIPFSELLPPDCTFFNSPQTTGKGGGIASVFKSVFHCGQLLSDTFSSFELQLFEINFPLPVLCAVVYRPPKLNEDFIQDFADFLAGIVVKCDRFLVVGDFNVHVCCETKPLVRDFLDLIDSFNLTQSVCGPTHEKGHTLDLVLSFGLTVNISEICETRISDDLPILFNITAPCLKTETSAPARRLRAINSATATQFSIVFNASVPYTLDDCCNLSADELATLFNSACTDTLDIVAPFRTKRTKALSEPWLNESTRPLRRTCRWAERKWKKDKLQVSLEILRYCLASYQRAVKTAKTEYISYLVTSNHHRPQYLFNVFNSLINACDLSPIVPPLCRHLYCVKTFYNFLSIRFLL